MKNLQSTNELSAETSLSQLVGELVLKLADVRLKVVALSYFDYEEVMVILGFPTRGVLGEKCLRYLLKIVERTRR